MSTSEIPSNPETVLFRPSKKRKIYRQRSRALSEDASAPDPSSNPTPAVPAQTLDELISSEAPSTGDGDVEGTRVPISEILRLRKQHKARVGGVEFRAAASVMTSAGMGGDGEMVVREETEEDEVARTGEVRKFAPQTGMIGDVNKHMERRGGMSGYSAEADDGRMAYIDSQLAKRSSPSMNATTATTTTASTQSSNLPNAPSRFQAEDVHRQPAALGKLQEIDLGDEARSRNVERTDKARRRLDGEEIEEEEVKKGKVRLGRDGKPWRGRKRRGSDDVKRDKLVEDILRENRLEIYDEPVQPQRAINGDEAADDLVAEEFRREFMDAVSQRHKKKAAPPPPGGSGGKKGEEELLKGPKLGGSRSARAAMREMMLKSGKK
ncbi:hypothetical protein BP6252_05142 [Coleophoma cylindrospora]|uniref:mRNA splicing factor RNA helicase n=1 Tax=Coleophoma cylindrospora TaxID=1849047 RepID=A0A3D8RSS1_9HELO|nr:hypothetical protein BP6252_05142 [Coleophoma cylindrospora]